MKYVTKEKLFVFVSCIELVLGLLELCQYEIPMRRFVLWGFFCVYLLMAGTGHYTKKEIGIFMVYMLVGILLYVDSGINIGMKALVYFMALKQVNVKKLLKLMLLTMGMTVLGIMAASLLFGFGITYIDDFRKEGFFGGIRYSLGFAHANVLQFVLFTILAYSLYLYGKEMSIGQYLLLGAGYLFFCVITYSKTGFIMGCSVWIGALAFRLRDWRYWNRILAGIFIVVIPLLLIFSLAAAMGKYGSIMEAVDVLMTGRIHQLSCYINFKSDVRYPLAYVNNWHLFSSIMNKNVYDMGYVQIFYYYGIVPATCYLLFIFYAFYQAVRDENTYGCLIILGFSIYLFMESLFFSNYLTRDFLLMSAAICVRNGQEDDGRSPSLRGMYVKKAKMLFESIQFIYSAKFVPIVQTPRNRKFKR